MTSIDHLSKTDIDKGEKAYRVREAVALFATEIAFLNALDSLQENGFDRADLSVLGDSERNAGAISRPFESAAMLADDKRTKRGANVNLESVVEAEAAAIGIPAYVGALGALFAVAATGGALALAIPMTVAGGLAGGGLGAIGAHAIEKRHRRAIEQQVDNGGLLLWVRTSTREREVCALRLLKAAGGQEAHVHEAVQRWGVEESPLSHFRPDRFLEKEPYQN
jgi:hypothetical protein